MFPPPWLRRAGGLIVGGLLLLTRRLARARSARHHEPVIVLSLGTQEPATTVAREAWRSGFRVHLFCGRLPGPELRYLHAWHRIDCLRDFDRALQLANRISPAAVLLENTNRLLSLQVHLSAELGLRSSGEQAQRTSNSKIAFREQLLATDIQPVRSRPVTSDAPADIGFPAIFKPETGSGSKGVRLVEDYAALQAAAESFTRDKYDTLVSGSGLIEAFVPGRQFDVEGVCHDGGFEVLGLVEEYFEEALPWLVPAWYLFNPPLAQALSARLQATAIDVASACGVTNGAWHCELRLTPSGEIFAIDFANRIGFSDILKNSNGVSPAREYVRVMTQARYVPPRRAATSCVFERYIATREEAHRLRKLARRHPEHVVRARFRPFLFAGHFAYQGRMLVQADSLVELRSLLREVDGEPPSLACRYDPSHPVAS